MPNRFPHTGPFHIGGGCFTAAEIIQILDEYLTSERRTRIAEVIDGRTYTVAPVVEGLYDQGNVSAVMRSAEALGYQSLHIAETQENFKIANRVTQGADKWLDVCRWATTRGCVTWLRAHGYRVLAMCMDDARPIAEVEFETPAALCFGSERDGVSTELLELADGRVVIPMPGFTRSFNISVAAGLALYHVREWRLRELGRPGDLTREERESLTAAYYLRAVEHGEKLLDEWRRRERIAIAESG